VIHNGKIFQIFVSQRFSVIVTPPLKKNISGREHYLKEGQRYRISRSAIALRSL